MAFVGDPRPVKPADRFRLKHIQGAALSPDGNSVVYALFSSDGSRDEDYVTLWLADVATGAARRLTGDATRNWSPQWSPDGTRIAFLSRRSGAPQVYLIPVDGGEAWPLTSVKQGVGGGPAWSPDGQWLAFTAGPADPPDHKKPYRVTHRTYRLDGMGYVDGVLQDIYIVRAAGGEPKRLTHGDYQKGNPTWAPNGREILFSASVLPDGSPLQARPQIVDLAGNVYDPLRDWGSVSAQAWTPDGSRIVFMGSHSGKPIGSKSDLYVLPREGGMPECRTASLPLGVGGGLQYDMPAWPMGVPVLPSPDGTVVYTPLHAGGKMGIVAVAVEGAEAWETIVDGERSVLALGLSAGKLLCIESTQENPADLFVCNPDGSEECPLTHINADVLAELKSPKVEHLLFLGSDGVQVEGWILLPPDGRPPYPTVLYIHGGPHVAFGAMYSFDFQMLAGAGFAVLFVNHRASTGYGDGFSTAIKGDWGNLDYTDLIAGVDVAIARGLADPKRLGVCGTSGGGNLTCWIVGHTDRFRAAVPQNPVTNWVSFYGASDIGSRFAAEELGGLPHEIPDVYARCSPISHAHRCKTPTLMVQGEMDYRCPPEQSEQFYTILKASGCVTEMLRLPESPHAGSTTGAVPLRRAHDDALLDWMNRYVLGEQSPEGKPQTP